MKLFDEVWLEIFEALTLKDLLRCNLVCKQFYKVINTNRIWKPFCEVDLAERTERFFDFSWTFAAPCKWKLCYLKQKVARNWTSDKFKSFPLKLPFSQPVDILTYNGEVLVVKSEDKLQAYLVHVHDHYTDRIALEEKPKPSFKSLLTNTLYLIVNNGKYLLVYRFNEVCGKYQTDYAYYIVNNQKFIHHDHEEGSNRRLNGYEDLAGRADLELLTFLGNTLYLAFGNDTGRQDGQGTYCICAFNLESMQYLLEVEVQSYSWTFDQKIIYLLETFDQAVSCTQLCCYDEHGAEKYRRNHDYTTLNIHVNYHILLAVRNILFEKFTIKIEYSVLEKATGRELYSNQIRRNNDSRINSVDATKLMPSADLVLISVDYKHGCGSLNCECPPNKAFVLYDLAQATLIHTIRFWTNRLLLGADRYLLDPYCTGNIKHEVYDFLKDTYARINAPGRLVYAAYDLLVIRNYYKKVSSLSVQVYS